MTDDEALVEARELLAATARELAASGARDEALARFVPGRRVLGIQRRDRMLPLGRVWRLGVLLLGPDGALYATGQVTRAIAPGRGAYQSNSAEVRRAYRAAAFDGPFEEGETVNHDAAEIELSAAALEAGTSPVVLRGAKVFVNWNPASRDALTPLPAYLADRVGLLVRPPEGA